jgi:hypothetical protein
MTVTIPCATPRTLVGLLGVDVTDLCERGIDGRAIDLRRLEEIERRILAMESFLNFDPNA